MFPESGKITATNSCGALIEMNHALSAIKHENISMDDLKSIYEKAWIIQSAVDKKIRLIDQEKNQVFVDFI